MGWIKIIAIVAGWIFLGIINFMAAVRIEGLNSEEIEQADKIFVALVILWPLITLGLIVWAFNQMRKGEKIRIGKFEFDFSEEK